MFELIISRFLALESAIPACRQAVAFRTPQSEIDITHLPTGCLSVGMRKGMRMAKGPFFRLGFNISPNANLHFLQRDILA